MSYLLEFLNQSMPCLIYQNVKYVILFYIMNKCMLYFDMLWLWEKWIVLEIMILMTYNSNGTPTLGKPNIASKVIKVGS